MASEQITKLLQENNINDPIESIEFIDKNLRSGKVSENECVIVKFKTNRDDLQLFMKICRKGSKTVEFETPLAPFKRETMFYGEILPYLCKFHEERTKDKHLEKDSKRDEQKGKSDDGNDEDLILAVEQTRISEDAGRKHDAVEPYNNLTFPSLFPKYYGTFTVDGSIYIVIERISENNYDLNEDINVSDQNNIHYSLKHLAHFHAVSYCMQKLNGVNFIEGFPLLENRILHPDDRDLYTAPLFKKAYGEAIRMIKVLFKEAKDGNPIVLKTGISWTLLSEEVIARMENITDQFLDVLYYITTSHGESSVLCHGDFHMANMAVNKDSKLYPIFFDFQFVCYGSALLDIIRFLYLSGPSNIRVGYLEKSLSVYCDAFRTKCDELGLKKDLNTFTLDFIMAEYKRLSPWGYLFGIIFRMYTALGENMKCISSVPDEEIVDLCDNSDLCWWGIEATVDIIVEADTHGYIDVTEDIIERIKNK